CENRGLDELPAVLQIRQCAVDQLPGRDRVVKPEPHALHFVVHGFSDVEDHVHAHRAVGNFAQIAYDGHQHNQADEQEHEEAQLRGIFFVGGEPADEPDVVGDSADMNALQEVDRV